MFARLPAVATFASLAVLAVATPAKRWNEPTSTVTVTVTASPPASTPASTCSTGPIQCCNTLQTSSDPVTSVLLGLLGIVVQGVDAVIGIDCSPISVVGVGGGECSANAVCCQNNNVGGLISIGCIPIIL